MDPSIFRRVDPALIHFVHPAGQAGLAELFWLTGSSYKLICPLASAEDTRIFSQKQTCLFNNNDIFKDNTNCKIFSHWNSLFYLVQDSFLSHKPLKNTAARAWTGVTYIYSTSIKFQRKCFWHVFCPTINKSVQKAPKNIDLNQIAATYKNINQSIN